MKLRRFCCCLLVCSVIFLGVFSVSASAADLNDLTDLGNTGWSVGSDSSFPYSSSLDLNGLIVVDGSEYYFSEIFFGGTDDSSELDDQLIYFYGYSDPNFPDYYSIDLSDETVTSLVIYPGLDSSDPDIVRYFKENLNFSGYLEDNSGDNGSTDSGNGDSSEPGGGSTGNGSNSSGSIIPESSIISSANLSPFLSKLQEFLNVSSVVDVLVVVCGASIGFVFMWWGVRKVIKALMSAFSKGKLSL